ncbi:MAG: heme ABC exporter ATP-binding protein CcmA [Anaerolineales bacterium]|nr:heme ABC exporter ATP-binding protein CcmA [Anaerolineales bacterium]
MIETRGLVKTFGLKPVLRGIDFSCSAGEFVALVGPNGAGKTTFLRILATLASPTAGALRIAGLPLPGAAEQVRRQLGVLAHQPLLYADLTAAENLRFFGRMYSVPNRETRAQELLKLVGLWSVRNEPVRAFSRGMQQRLAIARSVLHRPAVLLFDEPHTGLDQEAADMLDGLMLEVASEGRTVVMTTHDLGRAHRLSSRVDVLSRGLVRTSVSTHQVTEEELVEKYREVTFV